MIRFYYNIHSRITQSHIFCSDASCTCHPMKVAQFLSQSILLNGRSTSTIGCTKQNINLRSLQKLTTKFQPQVNLYHHNAKCPISFVP